MHQYIKKYQSFASLLILTYNYIFTFSHSLNHYFSSILDSNTLMSSFYLFFFLLIFRFINLKKKINKVIYY